ncbi:cytochrome p450 domain-containing protein [Phthorimaea operculella]|nr:cytochrome p450 domain-containing protein [Phthorimaea operculella]
MIVAVILVGIILVIGLYYLKGIYNENYWKKRGVTAFYAENKVLGPFWDFLRTDKALFEILYNKIYKKFPDEPAVGIGSLTDPIFAALGAAVFGIHTKSVFDSPFLDMARDASLQTTVRNIKFAIGSLFLTAMRRLRISLFSEYEDFFIGAMKQIIRSRKQENIRKHDFVDMCVKLQNSGTLKDPETGFEMEPTDELLAAQAFFFFNAGVEPTASALYATFLELGQNPDILKKVHEEIDNVWSKYQGNLTYEAVNDMEYLEKVLNEALRMYPPIGFLSRMCVRDSVLPVGNIKISKGTKIFTPIFEFHHDPKYFSDPEVFNPERFDEDNKNNDVLYQPFGKGLRTCVGMRYARLQSKAGIVHVLREFSLKTTVRDGGIKYGKQQVQVRPVNLRVELIPRNI